MRLRLIGELSNTTRKKEKYMADVIQYTEKDNQVLAMNNRVGALLVIFARRHEGQRIARGLQ